MSLKRAKVLDQPKVSSLLSSDPSDEVCDLLLHHLPDLKNIHTITLYLRPALQSQYYDYILSLQPKRLIFNPGTENPELIKLAKNNGIEIDLACTLVMLSLDSY